MRPTDEHRPTSANDSAGGFDRLLAAARDGARDAIGELAERYRPYLLAIANHEWGSELRGKLGASDLVQESLLAAQNSIGDFRGQNEDELRAWLRGILLNDVLEAARRYKGTAKRQSDREIPLGGGRNEAPLEVRDEFDTPGTEAASKEEEQALHAAMSRLPDDYQQVLRMRNWQQLSFAEIGEKMNRSSEAARKLWSRAVVQLQHELQAHAGQD